MIHNVMCFSMPHFYTTNIYGGLNKQFDSISHLCQARNKDPSHIEEKNRHL